MYNAVNSNVADLINNPMKEGYNSGASWTQTRETIRAAVQAELDSANEKLAEKSWWSIHNKRWSIHNKIGSEWARLNAGLIRLFWGNAE